MPRPRVCFLVPTFSPSGGLAVVRGHAARLQAAGIDAELVLTGAADHGEAGPEGAAVRTLAEARAMHYDVAIATWWTTAEHAWSLDAARRILFVQGPDMRMYRDDAPFERLRALLALAMPFEIVAVSASLARTVTALRPAAQPFVALNGIDKATFAPRPPRAGDAGPLRVLVEGSPDAWFKGVGDALAATAAMREDRQVTVVAPRPGEPLPGADRTVGGLSRAGMAALYAEHDVVVKLSRFEGLGLAPLEAFHVGRPCVVTPYGGHEDYVEHGTNGAIVAFDDVPGTAAWLDLLARDRALLGRLGEGALATAASWPDEQASTERLAEALAAPLPIARDDALAQTLAAAGALGAAIERHTRGSVTWLEDALREARALVEELNMSRDECAAMLEQARADLAAARATTGYRVERRLRREAERLPWR